MEDMDTLDTSEFSASYRSRQRPSQYHAVSQRSNIVRSPGLSDTQEFAVCQFKVAIDTREQFPWSFHGIATDGTKTNPARPLIVPTVVQTLKTGDYSIVGLEDRIVIERKSLADLYGTLGGGRERFVNELHRMTEIVSHPNGGAAYVIIEASWSVILYDPPRDSRMTPKSVYRSILAWSQREPFRRIHWLTLDTRELAERFAFRVLERFWIDEQERISRERKAAEAGRQRQLIG